MNQQMKAVKGIVVKLQGNKDKTDAQWSIVSKVGVKERDEVRKP